MQQQTRGTVFRASCFVLLYPNFKVFVYNLQSRWYCCKCISISCMLLHFEIVCFCYSTSVNLVCLWSMCSGHLPYNERIASLRRFYRSRDWDEWFTPRRENDDVALDCFLQVNMRLARLLKPTVIILKNLYCSHREN